MPEEKEGKTPFDTIKKVLPKEEDVKRFLPAAPPYPPIPSFLVEKMKTEKKE